MCEIAHLAPNQHSLGDNPHHRGKSPIDRFAFRPLEREDLPLLRTWLAAPHVAQWWGPPEDEDFDTDEPVDHLVALYDGRPVGMVQCYRWEDFPLEAANIGAQPGEIGVDYLIGEGQLIGRGLGPAMLRAFLETRGGAGVRVDVAEANRRSWRCLEKLGFRRTLSGVSVPGEPGPHYVYALPLRPDLGTP